MGTDEEFANEGKGPWGCFLVLAPVAAFLLMFALPAAGRRKAGN